MVLSPQALVISNYTQQRDFSLTPEKCQFIITQNNRIDTTTIIYF